MTKEGRRQGIPKPHMCVTKKRTLSNGVLLPMADRASFDAHSGHSKTHGTCMSVQTFTSSVAIRSSGTHRLSAPAARTKTPSTLPDITSCAKRRTGRRPDTAAEGVIRLGKPSLSACPNSRRLTLPTNIRYWPLSAARVAGPARCLVRRSPRADPRRPGSGGPARPARRTSRRRPERGTRTAPSC